jgi:hypothetical protein
LATLGGLPASPRSVQERLATLERAAAVRRMILRQRRGKLYRLVHRVFPWVKWIGALLPVNKMADKEKRSHQWNYRTAIL